MLKIHACMHVHFKWDLNIYNINVDDHDYHYFYCFYYYCFCHFMIKSETKKLFFLCSAFVVNFHTAVFICFSLDGNKTEQNSTKKIENSHQRFMHFEFYFHVETQMKFSTIEMKINLT